MKKLFVVDRDTEKYYMSEGCPYLALAFNSLYGMPIFLLVDEGHYESWGEEEFPTIAHVFVRYGNKALDIKGLRDVSSIKEDFYDLQEPRVIGVARDDLVELYMGDDKPLVSYDLKEISMAKNLAKSIFSRFSKSEE